MGDPDHEDRSLHDGDSAVSGLTHLALLEAAWIERQQSRAYGAKRALDGFSFQFELTLLEAIRSWLRMPPGERSEPRVFSETLSDIVSLGQNGQLTIVEVKRNLTSNSLRETMDQFELIRQIAEETDPEMPPLRFRISCARGRLHKAPAWLETWAENQPSRRELAKKVEFSVESQPREEILALLANELRAPAPATTYRQCIGLLFSAARTGNFRDVSTEIWGILFEASGSRQEPHAAYIWTDLDRPPRSVSRGNVLTGQKPHVSHLREGYFAPRDITDRHLAPRVLEWLERVTQDPPQKLPIAWLSGSPGTGKSVALLQVLAQVHKAKLGQVFYLGTDIDLLSESLDWALELANDSPVIFGIDDPYPAEHRRGLSPTWRRVVSGMSSHRNSGKLDKMPLLISAGTFEQARLLGTDFADDLDVQVMSLPTEKAKAFRDLAKWYSVRTGQPVTGTPLAKRPIAHSIFEWSKGADTSEFAMRLHARLSDLDSDGSSLAAAHRVLLANRLGLSLPEASLDKRLPPDRVEQLRSLLFDPSDPSGANRDGRLRFGHPVVADRILDSWADTDLGSSETAHLDEALTDIVRFAPTSAERAAPIRVLASMDGRVGQRTTKDEPHALVEDLYAAAVRSGGGTIPPEQLLAWVSLRSGGAKLSDPDPIDMALWDLVPQQQHSPDFIPLLVGLLRAGGTMSPVQGSDLRDLTISLLERSPHWGGWSTVAITMAEFLPDPRLPGLVTRWVSRRRSASAGRTLLSVDEVMPGDEGIGRVAATIIEDTSNPAWPHAWSTLWRRRKDAALASLGVSWLRQVRFSRSFGSIWDTIWKHRWMLDERSEGDLISSGLRFLERSMTDIGWSPTWCSLWEIEELRDELRQVGLAWIAQSDQRKLGFTSVWSNLWNESEHEFGEASQELAVHGRNWLEAAPDRHGWGLVFSSLVKAGIPGCKELGFTQLETASPRHHDWVRVWECLWELADLGEKKWLRSKARRWLTRAPDSHLGRPRVVSDLWLDDMDPSLRSDVVEWLERAPMKTPWANVWLALDDGAAPDMRDLGKRFCAARMSAPAWPKVWTWMWRSTKDLSLVDLAGKWLEEQPFSRPGRHFIVKGLYNSSTQLEVPRATPRLEAIAHEEVLRLHSVGDWTNQGDIIWRRIFECYPEMRAELLPSGIAWLEQTDVNSPGWLHVWACVARSSPSDTAPIDLLRKKQAEIVGGHGTYSIRSAIPSMLDLQENDPETPKLLDAVLATTEPRMDPRTRERLDILQMLVDSGPSVSEQNTILSRETMAGLAKISDPKDLLVRVDHMLAWLARNPGCGDFFRVIVKRVLGSPSTREQGPLVYSKICAWLEDHPDEEELRALQISHLHFMDDENEIDAAMRAGLEALRSSTTQSGTLANTLISSSARYGPLDVTREILFWAVSYMERNPVRASEPVVNALSAPFSRIKLTASAEDQILLERTEVAFMSWQSSFPDAPLPALDSTSLRLSTWESIHPG